MTGRTPSFGEGTESGLAGLPAAEAASGPRAPAAAAAAAAAVAGWGGAAQSRPTCRPALRTPVAARTGAPGQSSRGPHSASGCYCQTQAAAAGVLALQPQKPRVRAPPRPPRMTHPRCRCRCRRRWCACATPPWHCPPPPGTILGRPGCSGVTWRGRRCLRMAVAGRAWARRGRGEGHGVLGRQGGPAGTEEAATAKASLAVAGLLRYRLQARGLRPAGNRNQGSVLRA